MNELTWHIKQAKISLHRWYEDSDYFIYLSKEFFKLPFGKKESEYYKRQALKCKTLGLIYHDRYKMLLDGCWRKYD